MWDVWERGAGWLEVGGKKWEGRVGGKEKGAKKPGRDMSRGVCLGEDATAIISHSISISISITSGSRRQLVRRAVGVCPAGLAVGLTSSRPLNQTRVLVDG